MRWENGNTVSVFHRQPARWAGGCTDAATADKPCPAADETEVRGDHSKPMATPTSLQASVDVAPAREDLIRAYRAMYMARRLDDREILLKRQNRIYFQISGAGHEAVQAAAGLVFRPGHDWFYLYYRDRALSLMLGVTAEQMLLGAVGAAADPASGGRQMPSHWSSSRSCTSSPGRRHTGTQYLQAAGCAQAYRYLDPDSDEVTLVSSGEGATSEGEFWEALNAACLENLPLVYSDRRQRLRHLGAGREADRRRQYRATGLGIPELEALRSGRHRFHGVVSRACREAAAHARARKGPALVHATVTRPYSHSLSDDERLYKTKAERAAEEARDPLAQISGVADLGRHSRPASAAADRARSGSGDPASHRSRLARRSAGARVRPCGICIPTKSIRLPPNSKPSRSSRGDPRTMVDDINLTLHEEMRRNPRIIVFGEDVADCSREANLAEVKGKGGVFKATAGLQIKYRRANAASTAHSPKPPSSAARSGWPRAG